MPKLNAVAMVVLTLAVIAGAGALVFRKASPADGGSAALQKALRNLSDRDPDVGQEAASALRAMGPKAVAPLEEAAKSPDRVLAERAQKLLAALKPAPTPPAPVEAAMPEKIEIIEFVLESRGGRVRAADLGNLWVQLHNNGPAPVLVGKGLALDHPSMAVFEVEDGQGRKVEVPADVLHLKPHDLEEIVAVRPRESALLFQGGRRLVEAVSPGTYRIRFAYDALEGSDYRNVVKASEEGALLPPVRLVSNTVTVTVGE